MSEIKRRLYTRSEYDAVVQERDTLARDCEKQKSINGLLQRQIDNLPFCPDCRDKVRHESCPRCRYQAAEAKADTLARRVREAFRAGFNAHPADGADTLATSCAWAFDDGVAADREPQAWEAWSTAPPVTGGPHGEG